MSTSTVSSLTAIGATKITGALVWSDDSDGNTRKLPVGITQTASALVARDANGATALAGVQFPASQVTSADANMLDDYEEGTFTPGLTFGGGSTGLTFSTAVGFYTKLGNVVAYQLILAIAAKGSSTGLAVVTGLPFTVAGANAYAAAAGWYNNLASISGMVMGLVSPSATTIPVYALTTGVNGQLADTNFSAGGTIVLSGIYRV